MAVGFDGRILPPNGTPQGIAHMARVATLGCRVANQDCKGRCTAHHPTGYQWRAGGRKSSDFETIPLCEQHHQGKKGKGEGIAYHQTGREAWEARYGTQEFHLAVVREMLQLVYPDWDHITGESKHGAA